MAEDASQNHPASSPPVEKIEGVRLAALARRYGTPLYVYSHGALVGNFARIRDAFAGIDSPAGRSLQRRTPLIAYSMKSNSSRAVLSALIREGAGLDIVSGGELERGLAAGCDPANIVFAGVGKSDAEIEAAIRAGIHSFNIESEPEAEAIARVGRRLRLPARAALRINPDVDPSTHAYITTGKRESKFGIPFDAARRVFRRAAGLKGIEATGLHCHIGSQILKPEAYEAALRRVIELIKRLRADGHAIESLNLGGGFGIDYDYGRRPMDVAALARRLKPLLRPLGAQILFEPGRSISGPAGWFLTRVIYVKPGADRQFAIVDGAMNDLIRPSLYSAYHRISLVDDGGRGGRRRTYDVVGPVCETGDFLGKGRRFPALKPGDLLAVHDAGAYGMAMASNYNSRPRPAEVMVKGRRHALIRERESLEDLMRHERLPDFF